MPAPRAGRVGPRAARQHRAGRRPGSRARSRPAITGQVFLVGGGRIAIAQGWRRGPGQDRGRPLGPGRARCGDPGLVAASNEGRRRRVEMAIERFPVEAGHILMFARSIGDANPVYADAAYAAAHRGRRHPRAADVRAGERPVRRGLPAAPEGRPAVVRLGQGTDAASAAASRRGGGGGGGGGGGTGLHAEQHYTYHRPLRAGDVLTAATRAGRAMGEARQARGQARVLRDDHRVPRPGRASSSSPRGRRRAHREGGGRADGAQGERAQPRARRSRRSSSRT